MAEHNWHIREAVSSDAEPLAACIRSAYAPYTDRISDLPDVADGLDHAITNDQVWVAVERGVVVAGLVLVARDGAMKLANVAVHPDHGGKGLGRTLIDLAEREARRQGFEEMRLNTHVAMPENVRLYTHLGWEEVSRSGNTVSMRKFLPG